MANEQFNLASIPQISGPRFIQFDVIQNQGENFIDPVNELIAGTWSETSRKKLVQKALQMEAPEVPAGYQLKGTCTINWVIERIPE